MLILGATGPWDSAPRRPWIDRIHTASDQSALVRDCTKSDNPPASRAAQPTRDCDETRPLGGIDAAAQLNGAWEDPRVSANFNRASAAPHVSRGWQVLREGLPPADGSLMCEPDVAVPLLLDDVRARP